MNGEKKSVKVSGKKKGILAAVWESMTKTGGCCGSGGNCCGSSQPETGKQKAGQKPAEPSSCCGK
ncbi:MAG: hypothetical protein WCK89_02215 [bacterium]